MGTQVPAFLDNVRQVDVIASPDGDIGCLPKARPGIAKVARAALQLRLNHEQADQVQKVIHLARQGQPGVADATRGVKLAGLGEHRRQDVVRPS